MRIGNANTLFLQLGDVNECYKIAAEIGYDAIDLSVSDKWSVGQINKREMFGFFDASVTEPQPFSDEEEFKAIRIKGGGGTSFLPIFRHVQDNMKDETIASIIILTDGYAPYPDESERMDIPVLWVINNNDATPPWGMIARLEQNNNNDL